MTKVGKRLIKAAKQARGEVTRVADAMREYNRRCEEAGEDADLNELVREVAEKFKLHPVTFAHNVLRRK